MHIKDTLPELYEIRRPLTREELRRRLADKGGREYWRSLEELAATPEFEDLLHREFPSGAAEWSETDAVGRRTFIKIMGASLALAGLTTACAYQPPETIVPYVKQPEELIPGKPLYFATAMPFPTGSLGLLARSNEGRPTHIEGNPDHPTSGTPERPAEQRTAGVDLYAQASVLGLYDPDRSDTVRYRGEVRPYTAFLAEVRARLAEMKSRQGAGLRFLTETITSPTAAAQLGDILKAFPAAKWHSYEPAGGNAALVGAQLAFGDAAHTVYHFDRADVVVSLDSDFLNAVGCNNRYARDFISRRRVEGGQTAMNRLYAVETTVTNTGAKADHRFTVRPSEMLPFATALAAALGVAGVTAPAGGVPHADRVGAIAKDLQAARGKSVVVAGTYQSPQVHALAHAMNAALGNAGQTVTYTDPIDANPVNQVESLRQLVADIDAGRVEMLVIVGGNPVYNAPYDLAFTKERLDKIKAPDGRDGLRVRLGLYYDETSELAHWHVPETHYLESWSDTRAHDGTATIIQPLIAPLYKGRTVHEFLATFSDQPERTSYDLVRAYWQTQMTGGDFETQWRKAVHDGVIPNTAAKPKTVAVRGDFMSGVGANANPQPPTPNPSSLEVVFRPDTTIYDGRFANNAWLQELPKNLTKLTWDNAAHVSPNTARQRFGFGENSITYKGKELQNPIVQITLAGKSITIPLLVQPGVPDGVVVLPLGYGRRLAGKVGSTTLDQTVGFDVTPLRNSNAMWWAAGADAKLTGDDYLLALTQIHFQMEGREIVKSSTLAEYLKGTGEVHNERAGEGEGGKPVTTGEGAREVSGKETEKEPGPGDSLYTGFDYYGYKWGMAIDTMACVGCSTCVVACQSENNIAVVGKEQVARSREMHWLRVDAYFKGLAENPDGVYFMPVPCMHCENAPCEPVCPVNATVHDAEGTNNMVYNRCVGTRYCQNNCPYKVRRFNFLLYQDWNTPTLKLMRNPEVSIRSRGVMEKCTYCIQRIQFAKIETAKENRHVRDGEIQTACQSACPVEAIVFGDLNDKNSRVAKLQAEQRCYGLLTELNTRPRTKYLSVLRNPNPEITGT
ncbi:MAG: TAT-variant-translocated molybdopterin oxidoreductase [Acidobacteriota bacterium]|nr:TAT-variant-translocated molybdopterin oxidoreductase [Acidobacteriota bacterium]